MKIVKILSIILVILVIIFCVYLGVSVFFGSRGIEEPSEKTEENTDVSNTDDDIKNNDEEKNSDSEVEDEEEAKKEPTYIPEGFEYKEGTIKTGYVIIDQFGNEFVWIPVENGKLTRRNKNKEKYKEEEPSAKELVNSVAKNYGYYIARYESSRAELDDNVVAVSFANQEPWNNATYAEAFENAEKFAKVFDYDVNSSLMSSYAWDTALEWIDKTEDMYSSSLKYGNYSDTINKTGSTKKDIVNNICDLAGNLKEWTTEIFEEPKNEEDDKNDKDESIIRVVRGGCVENEKSASSQVSYSEDAIDNYWGFRIVLYK